VLGTKNESIYIPKRVSPRILNMNILEDNNFELDKDKTLVLETEKNTSALPVDTKSNGIYIDTETNTNENLIS
jgi:hypothetical protein